MTFIGIEDRNGAEAVRGLLLHVDRDPSDAPDDPEEFYDSSLVGCRVELSSGVQVGEVTEVAHLPAQDLLVVKGPDREVLVPFISEFVPTVDVEARRIVIDPPEGLLDLAE